MRAILKAFGGRLVSTETITVRELTETLVLHWPSPITLYGDSDINILPETVTFKWDGEFVYLEGLQERIAVFNLVR